MVALLGCVGCGAGDSENLGLEQLAVTSISTPAGFLGMSPTGSYLLTADIDMHGAALQYANTFSGTFDGGNHTIRNVSQNTGSAGTGLFGLLLSATVKNVKLNNFHLQGGAAGGLAGSCQSAIVQNVAVQATTTTISGRDAAGGLCGVMNGGTISNSSATGSVSSSAGNAGGLVGWASRGRGSDAPTLSSCSVAQMTVTGATESGGMMGFCQEPVFTRASAEATVSSSGPAGGICGTMNGGSIINSYAKGSVTSTSAEAGGIVGTTGLGQLSEAGVNITISYAQSTVTANTFAGGIAGYGFGAFVEDVYVVGNVTGTAAVGGLVGREDCTDNAGWVLDKGIYRGDVRDRFRPGAWSGVLGDFTDCIARWELTFFDNQLDQSGTYLVHSVSQRPESTTALKSPIAPAGGVYCGNILPETRCADNSFGDPPWNAGTSSQHHVLRNMPGPNVQPQ